MASMTAVIYARYSSSSQREESIEGQIRECTAFAERSGYTLIGEYMDRAISGKTDERPEFQKMIQDSKKKLFDTVLVWKLDRFARNRYDSAKYKSQLKKNGVKVVSATEPIAEGSLGILLESMIEGYAEYYSADLSEKVIRGSTENALNRKWNGGGLPIGFYIDDEQHPQLDPFSAPFVLEAYKLYADGYNITSIQGQLSKKGLKNSRGNDVSWGTIQHMLSNRRYIGEYTYRQLVIADFFPAIVPKDLFERVQEKLEKNRKAPAHSKAEEAYLLTTKIFCGSCGSSMVGDSGTGRNGKIHRYYTCNAVKKRRGTCKKKSVKKDWIEDLVISETMRMLNDDKMIEAIVSMLMILQGQENTTLPMLEKQLKDVEKKLNNIVNAIEKGSYSEILQKRLEELESARTDIRTQLEIEKLEKPMLTAEQMTFWLHRFRKLDVREEKHRQMLIDTFVNSVYVYEDRLLLNFNFKDDSRTITLDDVKKATKAKSKNGSDMDCSLAPKKGTPHRGVFFLVPPTGSNPLKCKCPVGTCRHQFKNW